MAKIDDLLQELCPDGVEWKELVDVVKTISPPIKLKVDSYLLSGLFPIIDQSKDQIAGYTDDISNTLPDGQYILYGDHTLAVKYYEGRFAQGADGLKILLSKSNLPKYIYYCICAYNIQNNEYKRHWTQAKQIKLPLPPLPIQHYIVEALDTFTDAISNLEEELALREKQFEFYKEQLLSFDKHVECKELKAVAKIKNGKDYKHLNCGNIPVFGSGGIMCYVDQYVYDKPTVLIPRKGSLGNLFYVDVPFWNVDTIFYTEINTDLIKPKYLYYYLTIQRLDKLNGAGGVPSLTQTILNRIPIHLPSLNRQEEIVEILDTFEAMIANIKEEIALRTKQYEYYREKLLSFGK